MANKQKPEPDILDTLITEAQYRADIQDGDYSEWMEYTETDTVPSDKLLGE